MPMRPTTHKADRPIPRRLGKRPYDRSRWRGMRARFLAAHPVCQAPSCGRLATEVDHKNGDARDNRWQNFQALCKSCHSRKTVLCDGGFGRPNLTPNDKETGS